MILEVNAFFLGGVCFGYFWDQLSIWLQVVCTAFQHGQARMMELQILPLLPSSQVQTGTDDSLNNLFPQGQPPGILWFFFLSLWDKVPNLTKRSARYLRNSINRLLVFFWNQPFWPLPIRLKKHLPKRNLREKHRIELGKNWVAVFCWETNGQWWCYKKEVYNSISICFGLQRRDWKRSFWPGIPFHSQKSPHYINSIKRHCYSLVNRYCLHGFTSTHQWWTSHSGWYHPENQDGTVSCDELLRFLVRNSNQNHGNTRVLPNRSVSRLWLSFCLACASLFVSLVPPVLVKCDMLDDHCYKAFIAKFTLNTGYITGVDMCKVCTEAVQSVALWTHVTSQVWTCVKYVLKQSSP